MSRSRTNNLHKLIDLEIRAEIDRDLVEQPPGRETYDKVYAAYPVLAETGVSFQTLKRWGKYLRGMAADQRIARISDAIVGRELGPEIVGQIRARLFALLSSGEASIEDLANASLTEARTTRTEIWHQERDAKRNAAIAELEKAAEKSKDGKLDPADAFAIVDRHMRGIEEQA